MLATNDFSSRRSTAFSIACQVLKQCCSIAANPPTGQMVYYIYFKFGSLIVRDHRHWKHYNSNLFFDSLGGKTIDNTLATKSSLSTTPMTNSYSKRIYYITTMTIE